MVKRTVIIDTEEHAKEFDVLIKSLGYLQVTRELNASDVALGIGSPYTKEELSAFLAEGSDDEESLTLDEISVNILNQLNKNGSPL